MQQENTFGTTASAEPGHGNKRKVERNGRVAARARPRPRAAPAPSAASRCSCGAQAPSPRAPPAPRRRSCTDRPPAAAAPAGAPRRARNATRSCGGPARGLPQLRPRPRQLTPLGGASAALAPGRRAAGAPARGPARRARVGRAGAGTHTERP